MRSRPSIIKTGQVYIGVRLRLALLSVHPNGLNIFNPFPAQNRQHKDAWSMKNPIVARRLLPVLLLIAPAMFAADSNSIPTWHAQSLGQAIGYILIFAAIGIAAAIVGYKVFDKCTPGDLNKEIIENKNTAAAIVAGAVILGVSIIIAAAMIG
jgi:putative membrane protein